MCIIDLPRCDAGLGILGLLSLRPSDVHRCVLTNELRRDQHVHDCVNFRVQHGNLHCAPCTANFVRNAPRKTSGPPQQNAPQLSRYDVRPPQLQPNTAPAEHHANNRPAVPGMSSLATSHAGASKPTPQAPQGGLSSHPNHTNLTNPAQGGVNMSPLRNAIHLSQNHQSSRQQAQFNNFATPNPPVRPHSTSRHHNSYDSPTEDIKRLLEDALDRIVS